MVGALMVPVAVLYDYMAGVMPCTLCEIQRWILVSAFIIFFLPLSRIQKYYHYLYYVGAIVGLWHLAILIGVTSTTTCLPFGMIEILPWYQYPSFLGSWLLQSGRSCGAGHIGMDLFFVLSLLAYYSFGVLISLCKIKGAQHEDV